MKYLLKDNLTGATNLTYKTELEVYSDLDKLIFLFACTHGGDFCPFANFNERHCEGDVCEIFIGSKSLYYEIEVSPKGCAFINLTKNLGGGRVEVVKMVKENFINIVANKSQEYYSLKIEIPIKKVLEITKEIYFNCFRIETDGGEREKYLFALIPTYKKWFHLSEKFILLNMTSL